jgi:Methyltransferase domain
MSASVPRSRLCTHEELESPSFQVWAEILREPHLRVHRKLWEWCFIAEILNRAGMLTSGRHGLGFAVGHEPLVAAFASRGARILATDLDVERAALTGWANSSEHARSLAKLNDRGLCDEVQFDRLVEFRELNMLDFDPHELRGFDFVWSSCAFEHLGSLAAGHQFVLESMKCLKPGGIAVHTTEFNVASNDATIDSGATVIYRQRDIEALAADLRSHGHLVELDFNRGVLPADYHVDVPPYTHDPHLKLHLMGYTTTSIGLVVICA